VFEENQPHQLKFVADGKRRRRNNYEEIQSELRCIKQPARCESAVIFWTVPADGR
jgi:hypothetical protein